MPTANSLEDILAQKRAWIAARKKEGVEGVFKAQALALPLPPSFHDALRVPRAERAIIAEVGRCSPYTEAELEDLDATEVAKRCERLGASALAVYTDDIVFGGSYQDVLAAAQATSLPILCKDFIIDPLQVIMARAHGASAVILVGTLLGERELKALMRQAWDLGLGVMVEAHSARELETLNRIRFGPTETSSIRIWGVSSRDLQTLEMDTTIHERLAPTLPEDAVHVAEGAIRRYEDIQPLEELGYDAFFTDVLLHEPDTFDERMNELAGPLAPTTEQPATE